MNPTRPDSPQSGTAADVSVCRLEVDTREAGRLAMAWAVARLDPSPDELRASAGRWLRGEEWQRFDRFKVDHARVDFLAGRMAAKSAIGSLSGIADPAGIEIVRGIWHQPCIRGAGDGVAVTLAHSAGIGLALAFDDRLRCGADLERQARDASEAVASQVSEAERAWAAADHGGANPRWMLLWTAREALGKCLGTGLLFPEALLPAVDWVESVPGRWQAALASQPMLTVHSLCVGEIVTSLVAPVEIAKQQPFADALRWLADALVPGAQQSQPATR